MNKISYWNHGTCERFLDKLCNFLVSVFMRVILIQYEAEISYAEQFQKRLSREKFQKHGLIRVEANNSK